MDKNNSIENNEAIPEDSILVDCCKCHRLLLLRSISRYPLHKCSCGNIVGNFKNHVAPNGYVCCIM